MRLAAAELVESREILPGQWLQAFHAPSLASGSRAGQFVHVRPGDLSRLDAGSLEVDTLTNAKGAIKVYCEVAEG